MDEDQLLNIPVEPPFRYPLAINVFLLAIICSFVYSFTFLPNYFEATESLKVAHESYKSKEYSRAISNYESVLSRVPSSQKTKIAIAKVYFARNEKDDVIKAIQYLEDVKLDDAAWKDLNTVMPEKYKVLFKTVKK